MRQKTIAYSVVNFLFMAIPAFTVNALVQYLFGGVDLQLAAITAIILGAFWALFMRSEQAQLRKEKRHS